ncbi:pro-cathepsin H-like [Seriola lalandi dorsalis]|uniref:Pro-cathepsin H n=1 Tax=Seriola lalandi dorsalis TaxID=1841481 RepID=A0A3B4WDY4_SERLL|nr:pro-cathepsin H-like [Seriola lalandi dorsalis]XP_056243262.1 pro-cathepsin H [Seriola aureovittata]
MNALLLFALVSAASAFYLSEQDEFHFKSWMAQQNKVYSLKEYYERLQIFTENKRRIDKHNEGNHSFTMGLNQFSDMTFSEFRKSFLWSEPQNCSATRGNYLSSNGPYPDSIDWRNKGNYVTDVKNQGGCGSCWTFSTTGCLESVTAITHGKLVPLSEQQLVDCAQDFNNHGCNGGLPSQAFEYIMYSKGLMAETDYPYTAIEGVCKYDPKAAIAYVREVMNITAYDEMGMVDAVATRNPVSFAFEVTPDFMHYHQGVYTSTKCDNTTDKVNHAVLAVGYGKDNGSPYWIVKNSWSSDWGINGYFLIERGKNMCGLAACSSFPVL